MANRLDYVDVGKGIAILLVVIGHLCQRNEWLINRGLESDVALFIYSFHMPVFFFMSGLLMALTDKKRINHLANIGRKAKTLIVPYIVWSFIIIPFLLGQKMPSLNFIVKPDAVYWYLIYVFLFSIIYELFSAIFDNKVSLLIKESCMLIGSLVLFMALYEIYPCESFKRLLSFSIFYYLGVVFNNHDLFVKISKRGRRAYA